jgi:hypothetical protein
LALLVFGLVGAVGCTPADVHNGIIGADNTGGNDAGKRDGAVKMDGSMKKDGMAASCASPFTGVLATYDFTGAAGNEASLAATSTATGVTATAFTRSADIAATGGNNSINSNNWPTAATLDTTKGFYTLSVTPPSGCSLSLTAMSIDNTVTGSGPGTVEAGTSADAFATTVAITRNAVATPTLSVSGATAAVEVRIFGFNASSSNGTFRVQNTFTVSGSLQ